MKRSEILLWAGMIVIIIGLLALPSAMDSEIIIMGTICFGFAFLLSGMYYY